MDYVCRNCDDHYLPLLVFLDCSLSSRSARKTRVRKKKYLDIDVLEAAKERISNIYDRFDTVAVCLSGGKDSLATTYLAKHEANKRGKRVEVVFRDEELIPDSIVDFLSSYRHLPWLNFHWFCIPLKSTKYILGKTYEYVQWDKNRPHVRPMPEWGIKLEPDDDRIFDQYTADAYIAQRFRGSVAMLTGIRADESLMRLRSVLNRLTEPYIVNTKTPKVKIGKPIYDWSENDVFKYLGENTAGWCEHYDKQFYADVALRVSTPLHPEQAKRLGDLRAIDPEFYDRVLKVFPEVACQDRYYGELDRETTRDRYGQSLEGILSYIEEKYDDEEQKEIAIGRYYECCNLHRVNPLAYPLLHILRYFVGGSLKRLPLPMSTKEKK